MKTSVKQTITFDQKYLKIEDVVAIAKDKADVALSIDPAFRKAIQDGADFLDKLLCEKGEIYGVTTGYGDSCTVRVPLDLVNELPHHLMTFHGCGLGQYLSPSQTKAVLAARLNSLCKAFSGVIIGLLKQIVRLFEHNLIPVMPSEGSVGASGDLTPLSYLAAVLCGEREVWRNEEPYPTKKAMDEIGVTPIRLRPKEGLALMNGTAVMTGLACMAYSQAEYLAKLATKITAMACIAVDGNAYHFDEVLFSVKPHPGQQKIAGWLRDDLGVDELPYRNRLQDRYSLRCAPHVIGVLQDALPFLRQLIENELNSANDNPIIDVDSKRILHGGHFYGGHIAFAMDSMKNAVANLADLMDRQMALLVDVKFNNGLTSNLSGSQGPRACINHGLKALQISVSAWTAEALKLTMPASVFSRSTECHNQDKVSMGTIAARDCLRVIELVEQVTAALLITVRQGIMLRLRLNPDIKLRKKIQSLYESLCNDIKAIEEDRRLEPDLRRLIERIHNKSWDCYGN